MVRSIPGARRNASGAAAGDGDLCAENGGRQANGRRVRAWQKSKERPAEEAACRQEKRKGSQWLAGRVNGGRPEEGEADSEMAGERVSNTWFAPLEVPRSPAPRIATFPYTWESMLIHSACALEQTNARNPASAARRSSRCCSRYHEPSLAEKSNDGAEKPSPRGGRTSTCPRSNTRGAFSSPVRA
jgi:hypothetical protein